MKMFLKALLFIFLFFVLGGLVSGGLESIVNMRKAWAGLIAVVSVGWLLGWAWNATLPEEIVEE